MRANLQLSPVTLSAVLIVVAACGSSNDDRLSSPVGAPTAPIAPTAPTMPTTATTAQLPTTAPPTASTTAIPATSATTTEPAKPAAPAEDEPTTTATTRPGEPYDYAIAGTVAEVAGVAFDDMFVIRTLPGDDQPVATSLPPLTRLVFTGRGREIDQGTSSVPWVEVNADGVTGWISQWLLVYVSAPRDVTVEAISAIGLWPTAPTMLELGKLITDAIVSCDPDYPPPDVVIATEPSAGPTSDIVYDTFPGEAFGSDDRIGTRYRITGRQVPTSELPGTGLASSFELVSVEARALCTRGVDESSGFCV